MKKLITILTTILLLAGTRGAQAGSHVWSGTQSGLWSQVGNWSAGGVPVAGESPLYLTFPPNPARIYVTNDVTGLQVDTVTFTGTGYFLSALAGKTLTLKGTGTNIVCTGTNTLDGTLGLVLSNTNFISTTTNAELAIYGPISGPGSLAKTGPGQLDFYGTPANTYTGATYVLDGTLALQRGISFFNPAIAVPGPLVIGTTNGALSGATTEIGFPQQITPSAPVTIWHSGRLDLLGGVSETVGSLTMNDGGVISGINSSLLILHGDVSVSVTANSGAIDCPLSFGGTNRTFYVTGNQGLGIHKTISDGGNNAGVIKTGPGNLTFDSSNSYAGLTLIKDGVLSISFPTGLGSTNGGTIVTNTGSLRLTGSISVNGEALSLSSTAYSIYTDYNTNVWNGPVMLASNVVINTFNAVEQLTFSGPITGPGGMSKIGNGTIIFTGTNANTYNGVTTVLGGSLQLAKTSGNAINGPLVIGDDLNPANSVSVQLLSPDQIADLAPVTVLSSGLFNLNSQSETIGSLAGSGNVSLLLGTLTTGGDNTDTTFSGSIGNAGFSPLVKNGTGTFTLNGTNACFGVTTVNGGKLVVNGALSPCFLTLNGGSSLGGNGSVGSINSTLGKVGPGNSIGKLNTGSFTLDDANSSLDIQIGGTTPGTGYDQLNVAGLVGLNGATLNLSLTFAGAVSNQYVIVNNDGNDAVSGTFAGLPEGAQLFRNGCTFSISYHGGDGNDVVLTQTGIAPPPQIGGLTKLSDGQMHLTGSGVMGLTYTIQANTNLSTTNWVAIGTALAGPKGILIFTDPDAPSYQQRFYRIQAP